MTRHESRTSGELSDAEVFRRAARLFRPYWGRLTGICITTIGSTALAVLPGVLIADVVNLAIDGRNLHLLVELCAVLLALPVISGVAGVAQVYWASLTGQAVVRDLRMRVHRWLSLQPLDFFLRTSAGEIQSRVTNDVTAVEDILVTALRGSVVNVTVVVSVIISMFVLNPFLAICTCVVIPVFLKLAQRVGVAQRDLRTTVQERTAQLSSVTAESLSLSGVILTRLFGRQTYMTERFDHENTVISDIGVRSQMLGRWLFMGSALVFAWVPALTYGVAGWAIIENRGFGISLGVIVAFSTLQGRLFAPGGALIQVMGLQVSIRGSAGVLRRLLEWCGPDDDIAAGTTGGRKPPAQMRIEARVASASGTTVALAFEHVHFSRRYGGSEEFSIKDVTFSADRGEIVTIVGPSGSGKSTIAYLAAGLLEPDAGSVRVTVGEMARRPGEPAGNIGLISQDSLILNMSIADNLRFASPDAPDREVERIAGLVGLANRIASMAEGYDTVIGERGCSLSNGERQRLSVARLLLQRPAIAILDEATNALDGDSQARLAKVIEDELRESARLIIAHQMWTVTGADRVIVLQEGRVTEEGSHDELIMRQGEYWRYARQQLALL